MAFEGACVVFDGARFDAVVSGSAPEGADLEFIFKDEATVGKKPAVVITFTAFIGGKVQRVQAVTTAAVIRSVAAAIRGRYGEG